MLDSSIAETMAEKAQLGWGLIEDAPVAMVGLDGTERIVAASRRWLELVGQTVEWTLGRELFEFLHPDSSASVRELAGRCLAGGRNEATRCKVLVGSEWVSMRVRGSAVRHRRPGDPRLLLAFEFLEHGPAAEQLRMQGAALETSIDGIAVVDHHGHLVFVNRAFARIHGCERPQDLAGQSWQSLVAPGELRRFETEILPEFRRMGHWRGESAGLRRDGSEFHQELSLAWCAEGSWVWVVRDITERRRRLEELRKAEERFRGIFEHVVEGIFQATLDGRYVAANPALARLLGYSSAEALMHEVTDIAHQVYCHPERRKEFIRRIEQEGEVRDFEIEARRRDGESIWVSQSGRAVRGADGRILYIEGTITDVTASKKAEADLLESIQFNQQVIENAGEGIIVYDRRYRIVVWNPIMEQLTGLAADDVLGREAPQLFPYLRDMEIIELWQRALAGERLRSFDAHFRIPQTGREGWVKSTFCPNKNIRGEIVGVIEVVRDVQQRRADQEALQYRIELEKLITTISTRFVNISVAEIEDGISESLESLGEFTEVERSYLCLLDADKRDFRKQYGWWAPSVAKERDQRMAMESNGGLTGRLLKGEQVQVVRVDEIGPEAAADRALFESRGTRSLVLVPLLFEGEVEGFIGIESVFRHRMWSDDVVSLLKIVGEIFLSALMRKRAEENLRESERRLLHAQKMEAVGRLAGGVAHDFNNLLTAITGYSELLTDSLPAGSTPHHQAAQIRRAAQRAASMTQQLLAFSRRQVMARKTLDLAEVVHEMEGMLGRLIGEHIELATELEKGCWILTDPAQIEQVIVNLVVNARDAMPSGGKLEIRVRQVELGDEERQRLQLRNCCRHAELTVADTGEGMDKDVMSHLFEPFFTTKEQGKGTGLGLSTVYGIVQQSGGALAVESTRGEGSTFRVYLCLTDRPGAAVPPPPEVVAKTGGGAELIVLAEDEEPVRELIRAILKQHGYQIIAARDGITALEIIRQTQKVDLLVTDMVMPRMGGRELAEKAKELCPELPVLYVSGYAAESLPVLTDPGREVAFLQKPFTPGEIVAKVQEVLRKKMAEPRTPS